MKGTVYLEQTATVGYATNRQLIYRCNLCWLRFTPYFFQGNSIADSSTKDCLNSLSWLSCSWMEGRTWQKELAAAPWSLKWYTEIQGLPCTIGNNSISHEEASFGHHPCSPSPHIPFYTWCQVVLVHPHQRRWQCRGGGRQEKYFASLRDSFCTRVDDLYVRSSCMAKSGANVDFLKHFLASSYLYSGLACKAQMGFMLPAFDNET